MLCKYESLDDNLTREMLQYVTTKLESQTIEENVIPLLKDADNDNTEVRFYQYCNNFI